MKYPGAIWKPVTNIGGQITRIQGLVLHVQEGNGGLQGWFSNPASQASSHFWVSKTGTLEQYVDTNTVAWAQRNGNPYYLSIETEGFQTEPLTQIQIDIIGQLLVWMNITWQTPLVGPVAHGQYGFTQHCNPNGTPDPAWGNHVCPGPIRLNQMGAILNSARPTPIPTGVNNMIAATPTSKGYYVAKSDGSVYAYGDAAYRGGINNAGPGGTSAMPSGASCNGVAVCSTGGYWLCTTTGNVYAFGGAPFYGPK